MQMERKKQSGREDSLFVDYNFMKISCKNIFEKYVTSTCLHRVYVCLEEEKLFE